MTQFCVPQRLLLLFLGFLLGLTLIGPAADADEWPHWMGPNRDNTWREDGLIESFPASGPRVRWRTPVKFGYAGPAVSQGRVLVTDYETADKVTIANFERTKSTGTERIICLDQKTGKEVWRHEYPVTYAISYPSGPRCTPIIEKSRVYCLGAVGNLKCLDLESGKIVWEKDLPKVYGTKPALWGYAAHPLIDGDNLITLAGGKGTHVVALNKQTGEENWRSQSSPEQGYSPPTIIQAGGVRQLILAQPKAVEAVNPENGKLLWSVPYNATSGSIIMTPIHFGNYLYVAGYNNQSSLIELATDKPEAKLLWSNKYRAISPVNVQPYWNKTDKVLYGMDQSGDLIALSLPQCKRLWNDSTPVSKRRSGNGTAFIVKQADRYWLFNDKGELVIAKLSPKGYQEIDRAKVLEPTNFAFGRPVVWSMPAYADKQAYLRNDKEIICVDLAKTP